MRRYAVTLAFDSLRPLGVDNRIAQDTALTLNMARRLDAQLLEKHISIGQVLGAFETNTA